MGDHGGIILANLHVDVRETSEICVWNLVRLVHRVRAPKQEERLRGVVRGNGREEARLEEERKEMRREP